MPKTIVCALFLAAALFVASSANASCIYNKTSHRVTVMFNCGTWCHNLWSIGGGGYDCRPGKGGAAKVTYIDPEHLPFYNCDMYNIDDHGWVDIYEYKMVNHANDGSVKQTVGCD